MKYNPRDWWTPANRWRLFRLWTLYVLAGSLLAAYGPGSIGKPSAILLVVTGCAVFNMRLNNRS